MTSRDVLARAQGWWGQKAPRERTLFLGLAAVLAVAAWWTLIWLPIGRAREAAFASLERTAAARIAIASVPAGAEGLGPRESIRAIMTQSAADAGIEILQIEQREEAIGLMLAPVAFDTLMSWTGDLSARHGIRVTRAKLARAPQPGVVTAELLVSAP